tara:strand:- start:139 stop:663 length:525 start_codon:yes stop_codon:yes gene_type:complete
MALWGNNDALDSGGTVSLNYSTRVVTGSGTSFGLTDNPGEGDVIRFGDRSGSYFGDAVIASVTSATSVTIGSTAGLSGVAIAATSYTASQLPKSSVLDSNYSQLNTDKDTFIYGVAEAGTEVATATEYKLSHGGWVGVTTYNDSSGNLRVKSETLVAMSGITTGNAPAYPPQQF